MQQCCAHKSPRLVVVPGLGDSDGAHWQSWLQRQYCNALRVVQDDPQQADLEAWSDRVIDTVSRQPGIFVAAAHSFGCLAVVRAVAGEAAALRGTSSRGRTAEPSATDLAAGAIAAVLLVAPPDPAKLGIDDSALPTRLPVPSIVVASRNDPWMTFERARWWADRWGSRLVDLGESGHVNTASGFGPWPRSKCLADRLMQELAARRHIEEASPY